MFYADDVSIYNNVTVSQCTMYPNLKLFPSEQLYKIESLKSYMEATTTGRVDQLWTKEKCSSHPQHLLGKVKNSWPGLWPPCFLKRLTWVSDETMGLSTHSACHVETVPICQVDSVSIFLMPFCPNVMQGLYQWIMLNLYPYLKIICVPMSCRDCIHVSS